MQNKLKEEKRDMAEERRKWVTFEKSVMTLYTNIVICQVSSHRQREQAVQGDGGDPGEDDRVPELCDDQPEKWHWLPQDQL